MRFGRFTGHLAIVGLTLALFAPVESEAASRVVAHGASHAGKGRTVVRYGRSGGISCVPFARENSGIELAGNASAWWNNAAGVYARGARPEVGSVLNFRANGRMRLGHVAVVANVVDPRNIEIDHANWSGPGANRGGISRNITVVDVSERNDWSAVRVALGHSGEYGSVYPTYGFIYDRADGGVMVANTGTAPALALNTPPRDLRSTRDRMQIAAAQDVEEVAEAVDEPQSRGRRSARRHTVASRTTGKATVQKVQGRAAATKPAHRHHT